MITQTLTMNDYRNKMKPAVRNDSIDIFRCFGILLMILWHIGFGDLFDHYIHAFHMPMFFVVSGMFFDGGVE